VRSPILWRHTDEVPHEVAARRGDGRAGGRRNNTLPVGRVSVFRLKLRLEGTGRLILLRAVGRLLEASSVGVSAVVLRRLRGQNRAMLE
jgi:hypothetical protein